MLRNSQVLTFGRIRAVVAAAGHLRSALSCLQWVLAQVNGTPREVSVCRHPLPSLHFHSIQESESKTGTVLELSRFFIETSVF
jgi:hypothetical protein